MEHAVARAFAHDPLIPAQGKRALHTGGVGEPGWNLQATEDYGSREKLRNVNRDDTFAGTLEARDRKRPALAEAHSPRSSSSLHVRFSKLQDG